MKKILIMHRLFLTLILVTATFAHANAFANNVVTLVNRSSSCLCQDTYSANGKLKGLACFKTKQPKEGQSQNVEVLISDMTSQTKKRGICASTIMIAPDSRKSVPIEHDSSGDFFVVQGNSIPDKNDMCGNFLMRGDDRPIRPGDTIYVYTRSIKEIDRSAPHKEIIHYSPTRAFHNDCPALAVYIWKLGKEGASLSRVK